MNLNFTLPFCGLSHRICQRSEKSVGIPCCDLGMAKCIICVIWLLQCTCSYVKPKLYIFLRFLHVWLSRSLLSPPCFHTYRNTARSPSQRGQEGFWSLLTPSCEDCHEGVSDIPDDKSFQQLTQTTLILSSREACFPLKISTSSHQFALFHYSPQRRLPARCFNNH